MYIDASNPFESIKTALRFSFGCKGIKRPVFYKRGFNTITLKDEYDEYTFEFKDLNYKYVDQVKVDDASVYTDKDYGKFFYEYGRGLLSNLMVCLAKADWTSINDSDVNPAAYLANYYNDIESLNYHIDDVVSAFKKETLSDQSLPFDFNVKRAFDIICKYKDSIRYSSAPDMNNCEIFYVTYCGILFVLYGMILVFGNEKGLDTLDFLKNPKSATFDSVFQGLFGMEGLDTEARRHIVSLLYAFFVMTNFYRRTSGLKDMDRLVGTLYDISESLMAKFKDDEQFKIIDADLMDTTFANGVTLTTFCQNYDVLTDVYGFKNGAILDRDEADIFCFGSVYLSSFPFEIESDSGEGEKICISDYLVSPIRTYLEAGFRGKSFTSEEVENAFNIVSLFVNGDQNNNFGTIDPGTVLQIVLLASAFRYALERSRLNEKVKNEADAAVDILDTLLVSIYRNWFKSGKYYVQQPRPNYSGDTIQSTLSVLKTEIDWIIVSYLQFVRFGLYKNEMYEVDKPLFKELVKEFYFFDGNLDDKKINFWFNNVDPESFLTACSARNGRSIVQCVFNDGTPYAFEKLAEISAKEPLPKSLLAKMSTKTQKYSGIPMIDAIIEAMPALRTYAINNSKTYMVAVYVMIFEVFDKSFQEKNVGNYFDFKKADDQIGLFHLDSIANEFVVKPMKILVNRNNL